MLSDKDETIQHNEILGTFVKRTCAHPKLSKAYEETLDKALSYGQGKVYMICGPSGVGKTTLFTKLSRELFGKLGIDINETPGMIPCVSLELPSSDNAQFNWKDFYYRLLVELNEPLIEKKIKRKSDQMYHNKLPNSNPGAAPELRRALENAIIHRGTKVLLIDEAQHFLKIASGKKLKDQMDSIKSLANMTGANILLFGTYELKEFYNLSGQLSRRVEEIHFSRYSNSVADINDFLSVLNTFQNQIPLSETPNLVGNWKLFYERSIGCIGVVKDWLTACLREALKSKLNTIDEVLIKKHAPSPVKSLKMLEEALEGEANFIEKQQDILSLQNLLGISEVVLIEKEDKITKSKRNVGQRNPVRDKTGGVNYEN